MSYDNNGLCQRNMSNMEFLNDIVISLLPSYLQFPVSKIFSQMVKPNQQNRNRIVKKGNKLNQST